MRLPPHRYHPFPRVERDRPAWFWERRGFELRRILSAGMWTIHDVINDPSVRAAVTEQWRLLRCSELDRDVESTIHYLEYLEDLSRQGL